MVRVARLYVGTAAAAEEVAQEAWLGVLKGLARFEGRCTLKAWIFAIVANCAKSRGALHVCSCTGCRVCLAQMRAVVRVAGRLAERDLPAAVREDLLQTFRAWKRA
jgi:hypothetical protein